MATVEGSSSEGQKELTKRERAFLGQLPDDFLRVEEAPRSEQRTTSGQRYLSEYNLNIKKLITFRDHPHLVPMTFHPQQLGYRHDNSAFVGKLKVTILQVSNKNTSYIFPF